MSGPQTSLLHLGCILGAEAVHGSGWDGWRIETIKKNTTQEGSGISSSMCERKRRAKAQRDLGSWF